jgi:hypothetical protein
MSRPHSAISTCAVRSATPGIVHSRVKTNPGSQAGWQLVVFTLIGSNQASEEQIYNFYVDPRMTS